MQFIGGTTGDVVAPGTTFGDYCCADLRHTVRFDRLVESAIRCGARAFIEISAHPALLLRSVRTVRRRQPAGRSRCAGRVGTSWRRFVDALSAGYC